mmetsp:Transcript_38322/g.42390  ORF Transcript_38322/g.42390 Transcript_38322/m.42390 type:complete len:220 (-) Transcript_38322:263-922(-)|eukprot:CAMPEP_0194133340 /NCGR_PEP_ID=MMETSP0152-20130528/3555_1 /TAXON_ID=1049557 /ORGANISM="Thalassiothrix antarctica, Strain L6-D1" /LENGTH=219 /DNA_ID=CAMNT_0038828641 /DNA_START=62 /DNA_END=721 /DNA_ORIENTATION=+
MKYLLIVLAVSMATYSQAFSLQSAPTRRSMMYMGRRGRGSINEFRENSSSSSSNKSGKGLGGEAAAPSPKPATANWNPVQGITSINDLPTEEGKVKVIETMATPFINSQTNPKGAVAVVKYGKSTYCTSISCAMCQIPLDKAKILEPNEETNNIPRLSCTFCQATFNLLTGEQLKPTKGGNLLGGMMKGLFSKSEGQSQPVYALGEKNGQVFINANTSS